MDSYFDQCIVEFHVKTFSITSYSHSNHCQAMIIESAEIQTLTKKRRESVWTQNNWKLDIDSDNSQARKSKRESADIVVIVGRGCELFYQCILATLIWSIEIAWVTVRTFEMLSKYHPHIEWTLNTFFHSYI